MTVRFYKADLPGTGYRDDWCDFPAGGSVASTVGTTHLRAWVSGRELSEHFIRHAKLKDGLEVYVEPIPKDPISLSIAATLAAAAAAAAPAAVAIGLCVLSLGLSRSSLFAR